jgi:hypothetical protein
MRKRIVIEWANGNETVQDCYGLCVEILPTDQRILVAGITYWILSPEDSFRVVTL